MVYFHLRSFLRFLPCFLFSLFFLFLIWAFTQKDDTLQALLVTPIWFVVLAVAWLALRRTGVQQARIRAFREGRSEF